MKTVIGDLARWQRSFKTFLTDMGEKPDKKLSIDRIDNNGPYCASNCRWATRKEQQHNKSREGAVWKCECKEDEAPAGLVSVT